MLSHLFPILITIIAKSLDPTTTSDIKTRHIHFRMTLPPLTPTSTFCFLKLLILLFFHTGNKSLLVGSIFKILPHLLKMKVFASYKILPQH
ncbi:unnamed protein product [Withania somnifera]